MTYCQTNCLDSIANAFAVDYVKYTSCFCDVCRHVGHVGWDPDKGGWDVSFKSITLVVCIQMKLYVSRRGLSFTCDHVVIF
jgi:hypothetical protein